MPTQNFLIVKFVKFWYAKYLDKKIVKAAKLSWSPFTAIHSIFIDLEPDCNDTTILEAYYVP